MAASLARALIQMGVKVVVAAGWAVNDRAAMVFAQTFYNELLVKGGTFGDAVIAARTQTHADYPNSNTWGAYQCYGDPSYKLISNSGRSREGQTVLFSIDEAILKLENIVSRAKADGYRTNETLHRSIINIVDAAIEKGWGHRPEFLAAAGLAYAEVHEYKQAIDALEKAMSIEQYHLSHKVGDELAGLKVFYALYLTKNADADAHTRAKTLTAEAIAYLEAELVERDKDHHLLSRLGSAYKRKSMMCHGQARKSALKRMRDFYAASSRAYAYSSRVGPISSVGDAERIYQDIIDLPLHLIEPNEYPMMQYLQASLLYHWCYAKPGEVDLALLIKLIGALESHIVEKVTKGSQNDFWAHNEANNLKLTRLLIQDGGTGALPEYFKKVGSKRQFASILDTLHFLETILSDSGGTNRKSEVDNILRQVGDVRLALEAQLD